jgi:ribonuclease E
MKLGFTTLLATALAALLLVPAAGAGPGGNGNGNGNGGGGGNGHGPPAWAGGSGAAKSGGKPDKAEKAEARAAKKAAKAERRAAREAGPAADDDEPKHQNPAWICKFEREQMGADAFAEEYGTNENKANAFGKCVSREAHDRDGVTPDEEEPAAEPEEGEEEAPGSEDDPADESDPADGGEADASAQAFFQYLWPVLYA